MMKGSATPGAKRLRWGVRPTRRGAGGGATGSKKKGRPHVPVLGQVAADKKGGGLVVLKIFPNWVGEMGMIKKP